VLTPSAGTITLGGESIAGLATDRIARKGVGYVPQVRDVFETLTVQENLEMGGYTLPPRRVGERIDRVLELFPALAPMHGRMAGNLSGGERKMLAMARVLMTEPSLLVLDEPTAGLAPQLAHTVLTEHVAALTRADVAVLLVEQRAREALAISDWAYLMVSGEVQLSASGREVLERPDVGAIFLGHAFDTPAPPAR
jgi:ABC-type branched-subunit amino acid transport system ATPase component